MKWLVASVLLSAAAAVGVGAAAAQDSPGITADAIKIGVHLPETGPASFLGQGARVGIELATAEINEHGGVDGRKLEMLYVDDRGVPDGGIVAARRLVDQEGVFAVLGAATSAPTVSVLPYFTQNKVPYYVSIASDPRILGTKAPNIYSGGTVPSTGLTKAYATFMSKTLGVKKVAVLLCDQAHCVSGGPILQKLLEDDGVEFVAFNFNSGDTDFTGQIENAKAFDPDVVFVYGLMGDSGRILPQLRRAGVTVPILGDAPLADPAIINIAGPSSEGFHSFWVGGPQFINDNTGAMAQFLASIKSHGIKTPENTPNYYSMLAYADVYVIADALRRAGQTPTRESFIAALDETTGFVAGKDPVWTFAAAIGFPRTFTPDNHQGNDTVLPVVVKDGKFQAYQP